MANIQLQGVYQALQRRFSVEGAGLDRFESDFLDSVNYATRDINRRCDLSTRIDMIASITDTVALSDEYLDVLARVVAVNMMDFGQRPSAGEEAGMEADKQSLPVLIDSIRSDILNQAIAADTDDESDYVALGGLG